MFTVYFLALTCPIYPVCNIYKFGCDQAYSNGCYMSSINVNVHTAAKSFTGIWMCSDRAKLPRYFAEVIVV